MVKHYIALVRHAEYHQKRDVPSALQPYALTEKGLQQAETGAKNLQSFIAKNSISIHQTIDCSPLLRAWQTAQAFTRQLNFRDLKVESFPALVERSVGSLANLTTSEIEQILEQDPRFDKAPPDWKSNSHYCLPFIGAESLMQAGHRVEQHINQYIQQCSQLTDTSQIKLFIGHGASIRHAAHRMGIITYNEIAQLSMYHAHPVIYEIQDQEFKHVSGKWKLRNTPTNCDTENFVD